MKMTSICIRKFLCIGLIAILLYILAVSTTFAANSEDVVAKMDSYISFLNNYGNAYWNAGYRSSSYTKTFISKIQSGDLAYGLTASPCVKKDPSGSHVHANGCSSNQFAGGYQCFGFAKYFTYYLFGSYPTRAGDKSVLSGGNDGWSYYTKSTSNFPDLKPGDFLRYWNVPGIHAAIIYSVSGNNIQVIDCGGQKCWVRCRKLEYSLSDVKNFYAQGKAYIARYGGETIASPNLQNTDNFYYGIINYKTGTHYVALRSGASSSSSQIGRIPDGATVKVYPAKSNSSWCYVEYEGTKGYAWSKYINSSPTPVDPCANGHTKGNNVTITPEHPHNVRFVCTVCGQEIIEVNSDVKYPSCEICYPPVQAVPSTPTITISKTTINENETATVSWSYDPNALKYSIEIKNTDTGKNNLKTTKNNVYEIKGLTPGTYTIRVLAENDEICTDLSNTLTLTVKAEFVYTEPEPAPATAPSPAQTSTSETVSDPVDPCANGHTMGKYIESGKEHPHYCYYICTVCGEEFTDYSTSLRSDCPICCPPPSEPSGQKVQGVVNYKTGTYHIAIRSGASTSYDQIGRIPDGATVDVYTDHSSGNWYYVGYEGVYGYSWKDYINIGGSSSNNTRLGVVNYKTGTYHIAIRSGAGTNYEQIGRIPDGAVVTVYPDKTNGNWYYVDYNGVTGYSWRKYIDLQ